MRQSATDLPPYPTKPTRPVAAHLIPNQVMLPILAPPGARSGASLLRASASRHGHPRRGRKPDRQRREHPDSAQRDSAFHSTQVASGGFLVVAAEDMSDSVKRFASWQQSIDIGRRDSKSGSHSEAKRSGSLVRRRQAAPGRFRGPLAPATQPTPGGPPQRNINMQRKNRPPQAGSLDSHPLSSFNSLALKALEPLPTQLLG